MNFLGSSHYKTECGAVFSLIATIFLLSILVLELYRLNTGINPVLTEHSQYIDIESHPPFNPFNTGFDLAIGLKDNQVLPMNIGEIKAYHVINGNETEINLEFCNDSHF